MKTVAFVPIKLNSERLPLKNIKPFTNGKPLISYILSTLSKTHGIDEIYVYCSDERIKDYLPEGILFLKRDPYYDLSTTSFNEVLSSFAKLVKADVYVLTHATAPFMTAQSIEKALKLLSAASTSQLIRLLCLRSFYGRTESLLTTLSTAYRVLRIFRIYIQKPADFMCIHRI